MAAADSTKGCATEDGLNVSEVAFGVLTSQRYVTTRLHSQQQTWLRQVRHAAFYSEAVDDTVPTIPLEPPANEELVGGGAWKNFPALIDLHKRFPAAKWVFFHDDDTYVFVSNLLRTLSKYDADANFYLGLYWTPREDMEWREVKIAYASGGAGYAISRGLMRRLAAVMPACHTNYTRWAGDIRVGKCIADLGVRVTPEVGFHHEDHESYEWDSSGGGFPYGHLSNRASAATAAPVTFHHLTVDQLATYYRMQLADERGPDGELYRYDFGFAMLTEYIGWSAELRYSFRVLFGVSVEVSPAEHGPHGWRMDFSDPLYLRRVPSGEFHSVIAKVPQIFNGDGCAAPIDDPHRLPLRKAAVVVVTCEPCARIDGPRDVLGYGHICTVWKEDACTLKVLLSLRCPKRTLVLASALDVGLSPGSHELVHRGQRATCSGDAPAAVRHANASRAVLFHVSLAHGTLELGPAKRRRRPPRPPPSRPGATRAARPGARPRCGVAATVHRALGGQGRGCRGRHAA